MHRSRSHRIPFVALVAAAVFTAAGPAAGATVATTQPTETHCVVSVVDQLESGEYVLSDEECYDTFAEAMASVGVDASTSSRQAVVENAATVQSTLAVHFDGANYTGSSFSVSGVDCLGGYINLSATWDNRVSSTFGGICGRIRHWSGANISGSYQDTLNTGNLTTLNNAASSIQYLT